MRIRGGSGLGDAVYMRPVAEHFVRKGHAVTVCSDYPDVFLGAGVQAEPFSRLRIDVLAHYAARKAIVGTTQWDDVCVSAKIAPMPFAFAWAVRNRALVDDVRHAARGRPLVLIHGGYVPMGRSDGFGKELLPLPSAFDAVLRALDDCCFVRVGKGSPLYQLKCSIDLHDRTSVSDLLDLFSACDAVVAQCSYAVPLAEVFDKMLIAVWASKGLAHAPQAYVRQVTPQKVLSKSTSWFVVDDWSRERIEEEVHGIRQLC